MILFLLLIWLGSVSLVLQGRAEAGEMKEDITLFYGHLVAGKSRAEALRLARQQLKAKYPHPYFWAPFILHGEG
jgi:hypothetical protein